MLLRLVSLVHQGLLSSIAKTFFTEPCSVWSSKELACCWVQPASSAQGQRKHQEGWACLQTSGACHHAGSSVLAPGQPLLRELASVFFKPKHIISFLHLPPNQIQYLNDWDPGSFSIFVVDKNGKQKECMFFSPRALFLCCLCQSASSFWSSFIWFSSG